MIRCELEQGGEEFLRRPESHLVQSKSQKTPSPMDYARNQNPVKIGMVAGKAAFSALIRINFLIITIF